MYCGKKAEQIQMPFGVVSGVVPGIDVRNGSPDGSKEGVDFGVACPHWPNDFNGLIFKKNVLDSCVKS